MFSGKTEELLRRIRRAEIAKQKTIGFKPRIDNRYSEGCIASHAGNTYASHLVDSSFDIRKECSKNKYDVIVIEEVQFLDEDIVSVIWDLVYLEDTRVLVAGLDMDFKGKPFSITSQLMGMAEKALKLTAICTVCGAKATKTHKRKSSNTERIEVGDIDKYEPMCSEHWLQHEHF